MFKILGLDTDLVPPCPRSFKCIAIIGQLGF